MIAPDICKIKSFDLHGYSEGEYSIGSGCVVGQPLMLLNDQSLQYIAGHQNATDDWLELVSIPQSAIPQSSSKDVGGLGLLLIIVIVIIVICVLSAISGAIYRLRRRFIYKVLHDTILNDEHHHHHHDHHGHY
jgi:hypothetical protein